MPLTSVKKTKNIIQSVHSCTTEGAFIESIVAIITHLIKETLEVQTGQHEVSKLNNNKLY